LPAGRCLCRLHRRPIVDAVKPLGAWSKLPAVPAAAVLLAMAAGASCSRRPPGPVPQGLRFVSLAPNITEIVCALGAGSNLVGRTSACNYPPEIVERVPVLADFGVPAVESILAARPDLVLHVDLENKADSKRMSSVGIRSLRVPCNTLDDIPKAVETVGALIGREKEAETIASGIRHEYALRRQAAARKRPRVLVEIWDDPITTVGRDSFIAEAIALAGGENIGNEAAGPYYQVSPEWAVERNPDVILCFHSKGTGMQKLSRRTGWNTISAVKTGRVFDSLNLDCIMRPGPRIAEGLRDLEKAFAEEGAR